MRNDFVVDFRGFHARVPVPAFLMKKIVNEIQECA